MKFKNILPLFAFLIIVSACSDVEQSTQKEYLGNPNAQTEVQIYSDLECLACAKASNFTDVLLENFGDDLKITFHHFPLESIHPHAFGAAVASECAGKQGAFWKYIKYVYNFQDQLDTQSLKKHALNLSLDTDAFNTCVDNQATAEIVKEDLKRSLKLGLKGTPSFGINGEIIELGTSAEEMLKLVEEAIAKVGKSE